MENICIWLAVISLVYKRNPQIEWFLLMWNNGCFAYSFLDKKAYLSFGLFDQVAIDNCRDNRHLTKHAHCDSIEFFLSQYIQHALLGTNFFLFHVPNDSGVSSDCNILINHVRVFEWDQAAEMFFPRQFHLVVHDEKRPNQV